MGRAPDQRDLARLRQLCPTCGRRNGLLAGRCRSVHPLCPPIQAGSPAVGGDGPAGGDPADRYQPGRGHRGWRILFQAPVASAPDLLRPILRGHPGVPLLPPASRPKAHPSGAGARPLPGETCDAKSPKKLTPSSGYRSISCAVRAAMRPSQGSESTLLFRESSDFPLSCLETIRGAAGPDRRSTLAGSSSDGARDDQPRTVPVPRDRFHPSPE